MFYYKNQCFYQDSNSGNVCHLNLYSAHAARILEIMLSLPK